VDFRAEFGALFAMGLFGSVCATPYMLSLVASSGRNRAVGTRGLVIAHLGQSALFLAVAISVGIWAAHSVGLGAPFSGGFLNQAEGSFPIASALIVACVWGLVAAGVVIAGDVMLFASRLPQRGQDLASRIPLWRALLASVYGGVNEEIYARLFVFSVAAWLLAKTSTSAAAPTVLQLWLANAIAALIFAIGHLPLTKVAMGLNFVTVARALALNGIPGLIFGWLYWRYGLWASMIGHFVADLCIQSGGFLSRRVSASPALH